MRIGLLSDTHLPSGLKRLWDEVAIAFTGVDLIWHAGDIVLPSVLDQLEETAPVMAARGNNDHGWDDPRVADQQWLDVDGVRLVMLHDTEPEDEPLDVIRKRYLKGRHADVIVTGHTHFERLDWRDDVLQVNPGSPTHPHLWSTRLGTVAVVEIAGGTVRAVVRRLGETPGLRNPGVEYAFDGRAVERR